MVEFKFRECEVVRSYAGGREDFGLVESLACRIPSPELWLDNAYRQQSVSKSRRKAGG